MSRTKLLPIASVKVPSRTDRTILAYLCDFLFSFLPLKEVPLFGATKQKYIPWIVCKSGKVCGIYCFWGLSDTAFAERLAFLMIQLRWYSCARKNTMRLIVKWEKWTKPPRGIERVIIPRRVRFGWQRYTVVKRVRRRYRYELVTRYVFTEIRCLIVVLFIANGRSNDHVVIATNRLAR